MRSSSNVSHLQIKIQRPNELGRSEFSAHPSTVRPTGGVNNNRLWKRHTATSIFAGGECNNQLSSEMVISDGAGMFAYEYSGST